MPEAQEQEVRRRMPNRRPHAIEEFQFGGQTYIGFLGVYPDTREPGDVWIDVGPTGSDIEQESIATGIAASHAIQCGCPLKDLSSSLPKLSNGKPASALGTFLSLVGD
jgi:hypothetical protein